MATQAKADVIDFARSRYTAMNVRCALGARVRR